mmetsp:Transcript_21384/g.53840  ORF Transcript_21384/g.53840 Transcript_21384/m.53840 type:complete len:265 (-) Transcript_21384:572-1366(-)
MIFFPSIHSAARPIYFSEHCCVAPAQQSYRDPLRSRPVHRHWVVVLVPSLPLPPVPHDAEQVQEQVDDVHVQIQRRETVLVHRKPVAGVLPPHDQLGVVYDVKGEQQRGDAGVRHLHRTRIRQKHHHEGHQAEDDHDGKQIGPHPREVVRRLAREQDERDDDPGREGGDQQHGLRRVHRAAGPHEHAEANRDHADKKVVFRVLPGNRRVAEAVANQSDGDHHADGEQRLVVLDENLRVLAVEHERVGPERRRAAASSINKHYST